MRHNGAGCSCASPVSPGSVIVIVRFLWAVPKTSRRLVSIAYAFHHHHHQHDDDHHRYRARFVLVFTVVSYVCIYIELSVYLYICMSRVSLSKLWEIKKCVNMYMFYLWAAGSKSSKSPSLILRCGFWVHSVTDMEIIIVLYELLMHLSNCRPLAGRGGAVPGVLTAALWSASTESQSNVTQVVR